VRILMPEAYICTCAGDGVSTTLSRLQVSIHIL
jgi:hypothetical protein